MGRRGSWFSALKKALNPEAKEKKDQKSKSKKRLFGRTKSEELNYEENVEHLDELDHVVSSKEESASVIPSPIPTPPPPPPPPPPRPVLSPIREVKFEEAEEVQSKALAPKEDDVQLVEAEDAHNKHVYSVALATAMAAEAAVAAAKAAAEVVRLTALPHFQGKSLEELAAIKIQTAFRGHLARRALRALRGLVRLKSLVEGQTVKRQASTTLRCMQTVARVQSEIRARRIRMSEENQALQRQLQQKQEKEMEKQRASSNGDNWNHSPQSKEELEAKLQSKQEAALRRERALAYSFSHQNMWKNASKSQHPTFMDPSNPHWGWSWLERWMAARPWESRSTSDYNDRASIRSGAGRASMSVAEISKAYALRDDVHRDNKPPSPPAQKSSRPSSRQSPSSLTKTPSWRTPKKIVGDEDSGSTYSAQSERFNRRHSIAGSLVRDDESLASSRSVQSSAPRFLTPTGSTKGRSRLASPNSSGLEKKATPTQEKGSSPSVSSVKKRLSFPASPAAPRRHSGPPVFGSSSPKVTSAQREKRVSNGWGSR